jgi:hypothetical protein
LEARVVQETVRINARQLLTETRACEYIKVPGKECGGISVRPTSFAGHNRNDFCN